MATFSRTAGVFGANLPTKSTKAVTPADYTIGGMVAFFERKFLKAWTVQSPNEIADIFGIQANAGSAAYGWDAANGFFANVAGVPAKLILVSHVNTVTPISAVNAVKNQDTGTPTILTLTDGYQGVQAYGLNGNRTGITVVPGYRVSTTAVNAQLTTDSFVIVSNPGAFRVGDVVAIQSISAGKIVQAIDMTAGKITFTTTLGSAVSAGNTVQVYGVQLHVWRQDVTGIVSEMDPDLGRIYCSLSSAVQDFYIVNVFSQSKWLNVVRNATTPASPEKDYPAAIATIQYPAVATGGTLGSDGTQNATLATEFAADLQLFNGLPIRWICNPEVTHNFGASANGVHQAMEAYCKARSDNPKVIMNYPAQQSKAQLLALGQSMQRSDDVLAVGWDKWLAIIDPFARSANVPPRYVPNVGHLMGYIVRIINLMGIHVAPCQKSQPLYGALDVYVPSTGDPTLADTDRTDLLNAGINVIHNIPGMGIIPRNSVTPSTSLEFAFFNGLMMRDYIKNSAVQSLQSSENSPQSLNRIREDKMAILTFLQRLWSQGSTGSVPEGETFGQWMNADGSATKFADHVDVKADAINNPLTSLQAGNRNLDVYFTYPAPAQSIRIGVGIYMKAS